MKRVSAFSYGVIPLKKRDDDWEILLIQHKSGHWSFPKGRPEEKEGELACAARELEEETGLKIVNILRKKPFQENYTFRWNDTLIDKTVLYFLAEVEGTIKLQLDELSDYRWVDLSDAEAELTFPEGKNLCNKVQKFLS